MSRILVHDPRPPGERRAVLLAVPGHEVIFSADREALISALSERRPDVLVYVLRDIPRDIDLLSAIRQAATRLPLILLGEPATLEARRLVQVLRPTYYGVFPLEAGELPEAVHAALGHGPLPPVSAGSRS